jgi:amino acid permease
MFTVSGWVSCLRNLLYRPFLTFCNELELYLPVVHRSSLELTVCSISISYCDNHTSPGVWVTVFLLASSVVNIFGTLGYANEEFWASFLKTIATIVFLIIAVVLVKGDGPEHGM